MKLLILSDNIKVALVALLGLSGCTWTTVEPQEQPIIKYELLQYKIPEIKPEPKGLQYKTIKVKLRGKIYYAHSELQASLLASNWLEYRTWARKNYNILVNLKKDIK